MSRHRLDPPPLVRPRYGRISAVGVSVLVTLVALLGGIGVIPVGGSDGTAHADAGQQPVPRSSAVPAREAVPPATTRATGRVRTEPVRTDALPAETGQGKRVVFSISDQRVWLVDRAGGPMRSYLVSGSVTRNLDPGSYQVYSRSRWAVGIEDSGVMQYFVRFTRGDHAAIGFHSIPTKNGEPLQTLAELGTPQSHGCIRQKMADAKRMWNFAPVGTTVVVVA